MASTMAANASSVHNVRSNRGSNMGSSGMNNDRSRGSHSNGVGKGFSGNKSSWNSNIWGDSNLGGAFADDQQTSDAGFEAKSGSGSLLSTSESDGWSGRPNLPWSTVNSQLAMNQTRGMSTSPIQTRSNDRSAPPLNDAPDASYFNLPRTSGMANSATTVSHRPYLNSGSEGVSPSGDGMAFGGFPALRNGDGRRQMSTAGLGGSPVGASFPVKSGFNGTMEGQRSDDISNSMGMSSIAQGIPDGMSPPPSRSGLSHMSHNSASYTQRPVHSANPSFYSDNQNIDGRYAGGSMDLSAGFNKLQLNDNGYSTQGSAQRPQFMPHASFDSSLTRGKYQTDDGYQSLAGYGGDNAEMHLQYHARARGADNGSISPSEYARMDSPIYTGLDVATQYRNSGGRMSDSQAAAFERRLRLQEQELAQAQGGSVPRMQMPGYDYANYQTAARINALQGYYPMAQLGGIGGAAAVASRAQREQDPTQVVRSALLEEFRANSKGNKRYELKDIYNHVVEFSGDQHGSRFIQQKLETANSDEKEQVFREIQPNCLQLMTDVFGNYVVQKLFEHGNQTQKKILANQMRGHVLALSTQMYGCRVVQKALEHILTDQQAAMVKELESHVLKCVRDQNGNHVIQKAIERVPSEYVQFIINAFRGQVNRLAAHPYGCRVIQRMLEHCEEVDRQSILSELHACTSNLIPDQFGNYVIQHVIENGDESDRNRMIVIVMSQLLAYSKHKFASNVVEKSIEFGDPSQAQHIISTLISPNDRGESPLLGLMRDQYGNYVIQKVLGQLKGAEREALIDQIKPLLSQLKKFSYGKQIVAIEKLIFDPNSPATGPLSHTTSTTPPHSHKSSPQPAQRSISSMGSPRAFVGTAPPTPPPTDNQTTVNDSLDPKGLAKSTVTSVSSPETGNTGVPVSVDVTSAH
ncbi:hypothetical protein N7520_003479 [Penicillium odoratum]|uniref:uncharacterized protein n=1 Tax=Penicillium odoratum TaxID=1167516 RepID=UPI0025484AE1|nr:uncharacterized protein N7520_003479 [Penicillium odoratum]KAJ5768920.1 hypothetical protein N7520_003479 [Penicillium odoratum]